MIYELLRFLFISPPPPSSPMLRETGNYELKECGLSHIKSNIESVKSKVGLFDLCTLSSCLAIRQLVSQKRSGWL